MPWEDFGPPKTQPTEAGPWQDFGPSTTSASESKPLAVTRGFVSSFLQEQPELLGHALEGLSHLAPEWAGDSLRSGAEWLKEKSRTLNPEEYKKIAPKLFESKDMTDVLSWMGEAFGSGLASTALPLATGALGALGGGAIGSAIAPGPGTAAGAITGGIVGGFAGGSPLNYAEVYKALRDEKVPDAEASALAAKVTPFMAGLDVAGQALPFARIAGLGGLRQEVARNIARRIASGVAVGGVGEGVTEGAQEALKSGTVSAKTGKDFFTIANLKDIVEASIAGTLVGAGTGAASGLRRDQVDQPPSEEALAAARAGTAQPPGPPGAPPGAVPMTPLGPTVPPTGPITPAVGTIDPNLSPLPVAPSWVPRTAGVLTTGLPDYNAGMVDWFNAHMPAEAPPVPIKSENLIPSESVEDLTKRATAEVKADGLTVPGEPIGFSELLSKQRQDPNKALAQEVRGPERVVAAAVRKQGQVFDGTIHSDAWDAADAKILGPRRVEDEGFITSRGRFVSRIEAARIVDSTGQEALNPLSTVPRKHGEPLHTDYLGGWRDDQVDENNRAVERAVRGSNAPLAQAARTIQVAVDADKDRMIDIMGAHQYGDLTRMPETMVKETLQNSVDNIRPILEKNPNYQGRVDFNIDQAKRTVTIIDNGTGMTPETVSGPFLTLAGTAKESVRKGGGFGFAKAMYLFESKAVKLITARNGEVSTLIATGEELKASKKAGGKKLDLQVRDFTPADRKMFPDGNGTFLELTVPEGWVDAEGTTHRIDLPNFEFQYPVLKTSPLFDNIDVRFNGESLAIGKGFPKDEFTPLFKTEAPWGTIRVYASRDRIEHHNYADNVHVLSTGLWQFSFPLSKTGREYGNTIKRTFYLDVTPKVKPEQPNYPFNVTRQGFALSVDKIFTKLLKQVAVMYNQEDFNVKVEDFGEIQFLTLSPQGRVEATGRKKLVPPPPERPQILKGLKRGDNIDVVGGELTVKGQVIPDITLEELNKTKGIDLKSLKVPQTEIDSGNVLLHDIASVPMTAAPVEEGVLSPVDLNQIAFEAGGPAQATSEAELMVSLTQHGVEKFGHRFYEYAYLIGQHFLRLRDQVSRYKLPQALLNTQEEGAPEDYSGLRQEAVGLSMAAHDRNGNNSFGLSIRVPFSASVINPFLAVYPSDPKKVAIGQMTTMLHELAHHVHRSEEGLTPFVQGIITELETDPTFDFQGFKQQVVNTVSSYFDIFTHMNGVYNAGLVRPGGRSFSNLSDRQVGDGSSLGDPAPTDLFGRSGSSISAWVSLSNAAPSAKPGPPGLHPRVASAGIDATFGRADNERALGKEGEGAAVQQQAVFQGVRTGLGAIYGGTGNVPQPVREAAAHADKFNWSYKWTAGLDQLADSNPRFFPIQYYRGGVQQMHLLESQIQDGGMRISKDWRSLGSQGENLTAFLNDLVKQVYLTPDEISRGVSRNPTNTPGGELDQLITKHKLNDRAVKTYNKIKLFFEFFIDQVALVSIEGAQRKFTDPVRLAQKIDEIKTLTANLKSKPYFPFMNFGRHFIKVENAAGDLVYYETFERKGLQTAQKRQMAAFKKEQDAARARGLGETVTHGIIPEQAEPFIGMPPQLLESIKDKLSLSSAQIAALDQIILHSSALTSFRRRFENTSYTPGYSMDFKRAFAKYFFHGGRYLARAKYAWALRDHIAAAHAVGTNKASRIANYMADHLQNTILDAKGDFGIFKGAIFLWAMGFVPAAAFQNLSQTPMITFPYLAGKFGDVKATKALLAAMVQLNNFYKRGTYTALTHPSMGGAPFEISALDYGIKTGRISETQAADLAGIAQGEGLLKGLGGNAAERFSLLVQEKAAWMFEMAEQYNRRIAFRAGLKLALENPNAKEVQVAVSSHQQEFESLVASGKFTPAQAKAVITAAHIVERTQFNYARWARPRIFRGRLPGTIFVFKKYLQSVLWVLAQNKSDVLPRFLLIAFLIGGLQAFPGWEDLKEIIKGVARWKFGKDFAIDREVRRYVNEMFGGKVPPDLVLHGLARRGFGIPAIADAMGSFVTGKPGRGLLDPNSKGQNVPLPVVDMSRQISVGTILPGEIGKLIGPDKNVNEVIGEQSQRAAGAVFSVGFNMYKALMDHHLAATDPKRWEKAVPRALASASKAYRAFDEGKERSPSRGPNSAPTIVSYDRRDTEHLMEMMAIATGFQTLRVQGRWDNIIAKAEVDKFYDMRRQGLLEQMFEALKGRNPQEVEDVRTLIQKFNTELPDYARGRGITGETIRNSMRSRERELQARETGVPVQRTKAGTSRYVDELFPEGTVESRRVR